jgi:hypothetical protein
VIRGAAPPPGKRVVFVRLPLPTPPLSYSLAETCVMLEVAEALDGVHLKPLVVESSVPTYVAVSRARPS